MTQMPTLSIFTASVGFHTAGHTLPSKLRSIANAGFEAVEIFQDDLDAFAASDEFAIIYKALTPPSSPQYGKRVLHDNEIASTSSTTLSNETVTQEKTAWNAHGPCTPFEAQREIVCASYIRGICASLGLQILSLQPMRDVEGWKDSQKRKHAIERVRSRFAVMRALGTDLLLCCSNCQPEDQITNDIDQCAEDFAILADEAARFETTITPMLNENTIIAPQQQSTKPLRIAFEGLSWGTYIDRWDQAYAIVEKVDRKNFGLCFDSFNTLGRQFADPCSPSGIQEPIAETEKALKASLEAIPVKVPAEKVFFLQVGDARKMQVPLEPSPNPNEPRPARMIWSRGNRLYPGEFDRGAFMPTLDFVKAVHSTGYKGPWSIEVFNSSLHEPGQEVQKEHAERGHKGLVWLINQVITA
ncbi:xylose isomerase-like protein [Meira miltonrushii]|uniref:Xylose isomerase-like protein n=1 Tax=Meira miltonrushii TaxID=1280837 RepID=A0A316VIV8_9BASI|nr:xylose isomerase-like protein [Meira miltonrushii]PWN37440.1 xylose isomerase-like protein [Meira miltonrushii]